MTAWISLLLLFSIPLKPSTNLECLDVVMEQSGLWMAVSCDTVEVPSPETVDASESRLPEEPAPFVRPLTKISKDDLIFLWNQPAQGYVYKLWNFFIDVPQKMLVKLTLHWTTIITISYLVPQWQRSTWSHAGEGWQTHEPSTGGSHAGRNVEACWC